MIILIKTEYLQFSEQRCLLLPWLILRRPSAGPRLDSQEPVSPCDLLHHRGSITLEPAVSLSCSGHVLQTPETVMYETTFLSRGDDSAGRRCPHTCCRVFKHRRVSRSSSKKLFFFNVTTPQKKELLSNQIKAIFNPFGFFGVFFFNPCSHAVLSTSHHLLDECLSTSTWEDDASLILPTEF